jgi:hypothetical protein
LVDDVAQRVAIRVSDFETLIRADINSKLAALDNRNPILPVGPVGEFLKGKIFDAVQEQIQSKLPSAGSGNLSESSSQSESDKDWAGESDFQLSNQPIESKRFLLR